MGLNYEQVKWYRRRHKGFREREKAAMAGRKHMRSGRQDLPPKIKAFLEELRDCEDRVLAAKKAGVAGGWPAVKAALEDLPQAKRLYDAWVEEGCAMAEDALRRKRDASSARAYLQAHDPRYRRQLPERGGRRAAQEEDEELAAAKGSWAAKARGTAPVAPPRKPEPELEAEPGDEEREPDA